MIQQSWASKFVMASLMAAILTISPHSRAVTIVSGPTFTPATNAPLAGLLQLTTDVPSRVSVLVSDGTGIWERDFYDFATTNSVPLLGFKPDQTNYIQVTVYDKDRNWCTAPQLLTFITAPLPTNIPTITALKSEPSEMEPGYTLFTVSDRDIPTNYVAIVDNSGEVVWYMGPLPSPDIEVRQLDNGNLFFNNTASNLFQEINMLGAVVQTWYPPAGYPINGHEGLLTDHGTILYISDASRTVSNFPSSDTISNALLFPTAKVDDNPIVEMSATNGTNGVLLNVWSPLDMLDPTRVTYLTYGAPWSGSPYGIDNFHANAILEDTNDNSIIVSLRNQNTVFDFSRSGQLQWILSPPALWSTNFQPYLLTPIGAPFEWSYGQHGPMLTPDSTLLVYDDHIEGASPFDPMVPDEDNASRGVEYSIDETNMTISQVWDTTQATNVDRLFTPIVGSTRWLPKTRDVLVTYGFITYVNGAPPNPNAPSATAARIIEYTHDPVPQVVFDLSFYDTNANPNSQGVLVYRSDRIPDLYGHLAEPVPDLVVSDGNGIPLLEFSADPTYSYLVQASTDLTNWTTIGTAVQEDGVGDYDFEDLYANQFAARFYRVVTVTQ